MQHMTEDELNTEFDRIVARYPNGLAEMVGKNRSRIVWQTMVVQENAPSGCLVVDLGGGVVPFAALCSRAGFKARVVDDFGDATYSEADQALKVLEAEGVEIESTDLFDPAFEVPSGTGFVTCHDSMEHWHNSPKALLHQTFHAIQPGGAIWVGVPNAANLRKRLTVPLGKATWSSMNDWYEEPVFRGHVREPVIADLNYISEDLGAGKSEIFGRNWIGYRHPSSFVRNTVPRIDGLLQRWPGLCSDIYLLKFKPRD